MSGNVLSRLRLAGARAYARLSELADVLGFALKLAFEKGLLGQTVRITFAKSGLEKLEKVAEYLRQAGFVRWSTLDPKKAPDANLSLASVLVDIASRMRGVRTGSGVSAGRIVAYFNTRPDAPPVSSGRQKGRQKA